MPEPRRGTEQRSAVDFNQIPWLNAVMEVLSEYPTSPTPGRFFYHSTEEKGYIYTPDGWVSLNTSGATNLGTGSKIFVSIFQDSLRFRSLKNGSARLTVIEGANEITFDVSEADLHLENLSGIVPVEKGGTGATTVGEARLALGVPGKLAFTIGDGVSQDYNINHGLNTRDIGILLREDFAPYSMIVADVSFTDMDNLLVHFDSIPASNSIRAVLWG